MMATLPALVDGCQASPRLAVYRSSASYPLPWMSVPLPVTLPQNRLVATAFNSSGRRFHSFHSSQPTLAIKSTSSSSSSAQRPNLRLVTSLGRPAPIHSSIMKKASALQSASAAKASSESQEATDGIITDIVEDALVWAALNGLLVGDRSVKGSGLTPGIGMVHAPLSVLPTRFPRDLFFEAVGLATSFNALADAVSLDPAFLNSCLSKAAETDDFTAKLLEIYNSVLSDPVAVEQPIRLGMHRSDYMVDTETGMLLQVELNTISSSFAGLATLTSRLHKHLVERWGSQQGLDAASVPHNGAADNMAEALALGWKAFGNPTGVVMVVVQPIERNMYDQHWLTSKLWESHGIVSIRRTLAEIEAQGSLKADGTLLIGAVEVSVVYYRAGYGPGDYPTESEWSARLLVEKSRAVKCPNIAYHLTGSKKIQQELARPGVLERYVKDGEKARALRKCFAGLWSLDGAEGRDAVRDALTNPERYVLKPQREGGGNNVYGENIRSKLEELGASSSSSAQGGGGGGGGGGEGLGAYILMQRIFPAIERTWLVRVAQCTHEDSLSELGIFSTYLRRGDEVIIDKAAGHLLRTKTASSDEGGVAAGFAVLDSPYLI